MSGPASVSVVLNLPPKSLQTLAVELLCPECGWRWRGTGIEGLFYVTAELNQHLAQVHGRVEGVAREAIFGPREGA